MNVRQFSMALGLGLFVSAGLTSGVSALNASDIGNLLNLSEPDAAKVCDLVCNRLLAVSGQTTVINECLACKKNVGNFQTVLVNKMKGMTKKGAKVDKDWINNLCQKAKDANSPAFQALRETCDSQDVKTALSTSGGLMD